jgi:hypothetical protein
VVLAVTGTCLWKAPEPGDVSLDMHVPSTFEHWKGDVHYCRGEALKAELRGTILNRDGGSILQRVERDTLPSQLATGRSD